MRIDKLIEKYGKKAEDIIEDAIDALSPELFGEVMTFFGEAAQKFNGGL